MSARPRPVLRRERPGDPVEFPPPPADVVEQLRALFPPVRVEVSGRAS